MSRRLRNRHHQSSSMGKSHHLLYSGSSTSFPECYSILGTPITMPQKFLPLIQNDRINWIGSSQQFDYDNHLFSIDQKIMETSVLTVNVTFAGQIIQKSNTFINNIVVFCSLAFCCLLSVLNMNFFRKKYFTKYQITKSKYQVLCDFIKNCKKCENLIINFQDNKFNAEKLKILLSSIQQSMEKNQGLSMRGLCQKRKKVVLRNFCYQIDDSSFPLSQLKKQISKFSQKKNMQDVDILFVWQKTVIKNQGQNEKNEENQGLLASIGC